MSNNNDKEVFDLLFGLTPAQVKILRTQVRPVFKKRGYTIRITAPKPNGKLDVSIRAEFSGWRCIELFDKLTEMRRTAEAVLGEPERKR